MSVSSVGGSSLPTKKNFMSYCTVFVEVRFLFTHRRNAHVLLCCFFVMFGSSLPTEGTLMSYCTVLCDVWFLTQYNET
jgi:hypothetical protein